MLICHEDDNIYMKDYVKSTVVSTINSKTKKDIHNYLHELYESQNITNKPLRQMRQTTTGTGFSSLTRNLRQSIKQNQ